MDKGPFLLVSPVVRTPQPLTRNPVLNILQNYFGRSANLAGPVRYE
jgi:hypothetical protein